MSTPVWCVYGYLLFVYLKIGRSWMCGRCLYVYVFVCVFETLFGE